MHAQRLLPADGSPRKTLLARLSPQAFRLLLLSTVAFGAALAAAGMETLATMRGAYYQGQVRARAVSPLPYLAPLPKLHALAGGRENAVLVRVDSVGRERRALCALATGAAHDGITWIALSAAVEPCLGGRPIRRGSAEEAGELLRARWVVVDGDGRARFSGRDVPAADELRETAALFFSSEEHL